MSNVKAARVAAGPNKAEPLTDTEIAQVELRALKAIRNLSKDERLARTHELVEVVRPMTIVAGDVVAMTKPQLPKTSKTSVTSSSAYNRTSPG